MVAYQSLCKSSKLFLLNSLTVQLLPTFSLNRWSLGTGSRNWSNLDANWREVEYCCVEMTCPSLVLTRGLETAFLMKVVILMVILVEYCLDTVLKMWAVGAGQGNGVSRGASPALMLYDEEGGEKG